MKKEIISHLPEILTHADVFQAKRELKHLFEEFQTAKQKKLDEDHALFEKEIAELSDEEKAEKHFTPIEDPLDEEFETNYREVRFALNEKIEAEKEKLKTIYANKIAICDKLTALVHEENISLAFKTFNELKEEWKNAGQASRVQEKELHDKHSAIVKEFYYNMNIYKELKAYDFDKNYKIRKDLIEKLKSLKAISSIKEKQDKYHKLREKWYEAGPVSKEQYEELHDAWKEVDDLVHDELGEYYEKLHEEQELNLTKKKALVERMQSIDTSEINTHAKWQKKTHEVLAIQSEWKKIGFARRKENEKIWKEFRAECDKFFEVKQVFYDELKLKQNKNKEDKLKLVEKAESLKESTDWKNTTEQLIRFQKEWKKIPPAHHRDEKKLWSRFRLACNSFFDHKKNHFSHVDEAQDENLLKKNKIIEEIEALEMGDNKSENLKLLKAQTEKWNEIGHVPFKEKDNIIKRYQRALSVHYDKIKLNENEKVEILYRNKIDQLLGSNDPEDALYSEKNFLRDKINRLNGDLIQYQNNMGFLNSSNTSLLKGLTKNLDKTQAEIDLLKRKVDLINKALKELD